MATNLQILQPLALSVRNPTVPRSHDPHGLQDRAGDLHLYPPPLYHHQVRIL